MTRRAWLFPLLFASMVAGGCATSGNPPRPQPFPTPAPTPPPVIETPPAVSPLIASALALRGSPYLDGGSEPTRGFDCSGFVQWVFAQHGTALPRETRQQYDEGKRIRREEVRPGDLVFFETVSRGPSHVGIAIGAGAFVHAPSSRGVVRVESYESEYWSSRWVGARRINGSS
jgi:cell wall-associated NlpC family hydrolase